MRLVVSFNGRKIEFSVRQTGFFSRGLGLTFRTKDTSILLFDFSRAVTWQGNLTSLFVFFPFLTLWLDEKNKVIGFKIVRPFTFSISQKRKFYRIVEIPLNNSNFPLVKKFVSTKTLAKYYRR
ncbi:MAG: hypothetical protein AABX23_01955 [Nanoarchaeota archaeon]